MTPAAIVLACATVGLLTMPALDACHRLAIRWHVVALDGSGRATRDPVPCLGGLAVFGTLLPALWLVSATGLLGSGGGESARWLGTAAMVAVGFVDDRWTLALGPKVLAQSAVCIGYLIMVPPTAGAWSPWLALAFLLFIVNAFNVVDVMDGLLIVVGGVAAIGLLAGPFLSVPLERVECWGLLAALGAAFAFNRPPARIYLGDAGALAIGFFLGTLFLESWPGSPPAEGFVHLFAFSVPVFEVGLIATARRRRGASPFRASPDHFALRLLRQGRWSKHRVLLATGAIGLFFDLWCFMPVDRILSVTGWTLVAGSVSLMALAVAYCIRLAPRSAISNLEHP